MRALALIALALALATALWGCQGAQEAEQVRLPVEVDASGIEPVDTDLGYTVRLDRVRLSLGDLVFTIAGEVHTATLWEKAQRWCLPQAHAHPGHYQGGDVTGELPGTFLVDWLAQDGQTLGEATLLAGTYSAANFTFYRAQGLGDDPMEGHSAHLEGTATQGERSYTFTLLVDAPEGRQLVGAPLEATLDAQSQGRLLLRFVPQDALEGDTLFDGVDFAALDSDGDGHITLAPGDSAVEDTYNRFTRVFLTHDHYNLRYEE